ncbi:YjgF/Yer057p/UK114 family [Penicillium digitatum]|uniref:YjgF/Yer057p/UK114 family n=1 Tax=Penicillium digitatum TaxID=36651 RepID=A0A7T7BHK8_PENDI|nr:YjgF/Yer057p/UK114 family [Penicillium digitatum]
MVVSNTVHYSGQLEVDPITGDMAEGTVQDPRQKILHNLNTILEAGGSSLNIFLTGMGGFSVVNEVYATFVSDLKRASIYVVKIMRFEFHREYVSVWNPSFLS